MTLEYKHYISPKGAELRSLKQDFRVEYCRWKNVVKKKDPTKHDQLSYWRRLIIEKINKYLTSIS